MMLVRNVSLAVVATVAATAGLLVAPTVASATPTNCKTTRYVNQSGTVVCTGGTGTYRVWLTCEQFPSGGYYNVYGRFVGIGQTSSAICDSGDSLVTVRYQYG
jgi:hypothetical protein